MPKIVKAFSRQLSHIVIAVGVVLEANAYDAFEIYTMQDEVARHATYLHNKQDNFGQPQMLDTGLAGERIDPRTGVISFYHEYINLAGNSKLPVIYGRILNSDTVDWYGWEHDIPKITTTVIEEKADSDGRNGYKWQANRCSGKLYWGSVSLSGYYNFPDHFHESRYSSYPSPVVLPLEKYWSGVYLHTLGGNERPLLRKGGGGAVSHTTRDHWRLECIPSASDGGEGFKATSPDGIIYIFDKLVYLKKTLKDYIEPSGRDAAFSGPNASNETASYHTEQATMLVSEIRDVHNNWVKYDYDNFGRIQKIEANDGRLIEFTSEGRFFVAKATNVNASTAPRVWSFSSSEVNLPDGRKWVLDDEGSLVSDPLFHCEGEAWSGSVTHPSGAIVTFQFKQIYHLYSAPVSPRKMWNCWLQTSSQRDHDFLGQGFGGPGNGSLNYAVKKKTVTLPTGEVYTWDYEYEYESWQALWDVEAGPLPTYNWSSVTGPDGTKTKHYFNRQGTFWSQHLLKKTEIYDANGELVQTLDVDHERGVNHGYHVIVGQDFYGRNTSEQKLVRDGVTYTTEYSNFNFDKPGLIKTFSSLDSNEKRETAITYKNITDKWILSLPEVVKKNNKVFTTLRYDDFGRIIEHDKFNIENFEKFTYHPSGSDKGLLKRYEQRIDSSKTLTSTFEDYKFGTARKFTRPDGIVIERSVNDFGQITGEKDANQKWWYYDYNDAGWLRAINRPDNWSSTTIEYSFPESGGVLTTSTLGPTQTITAYDGMYRPVLVETKASSGGGQSVYKKTEYDAFNRITFSSYPSHNAVPSTGKYSEFDALGRLTKTWENVTGTPTTLFDYQPSGYPENSVKVTDAEGNITITSSRGYGDPDDGNVELIRSKNKDTDTYIYSKMVYDIYGNMTSVQQYDDDDTYSGDNYTQHYSYRSDNLQLCRHYTSETGSKYFTRNFVDLVVEYAEGQGGTTGCNFTIPSGSSVTQTYDDLLQPDVTNFPGATPDVDIDFYPTGNMKSIKRGGVNWAYEYNTLNLLEKETLAFDGRSFTLDHEYNNQGHQNQLIYPSGKTVSLGVNGLGQLTSVGGYVTAVTYHPSGTLDTITYGNGMTYSTSLNDRQLPSDMFVRKSNGDTLSDLVFNWDRNANVTLIQDLVKPRYTVDMEYDGLNRLTGANGYWGNGTISYDGVGNIRTKNLGNQTLTYHYDAFNRLDNISGSKAYTFAYDQRGNVNYNGDRSFTFDLSNQLVSSDGLGFQYDGHGRRVSKVVEGQKTISLYGSDGTLYYRQKPNGDHIDYLYLNGRLISTVESR